MCTCCGFTAAFVTVMNDIPRKTSIRKEFIAHASEENNHFTLIEDASGKELSNRIS